MYATRPGRTSAVVLAFDPEDAPVISGVRLERGQVARGVQVGDEVVLHKTSPTKISKVTRKK